jgi:hypothetical protein
MKAPKFPFPPEPSGTRLFLPLAKGEARRGLKGTTAAVYWQTPSQSHMRQLKAQGIEKVKKKWQVEVDLTT